MYDERAMVVNWIKAAWEICREENKFPHMKESHSLVPSREVKNKYNVLS